MKTTYTTPVAATSGDVVHTTLGGKPAFNEVLNISTKPSGGGNLSFGL